MRHFIRWSFYFVCYALWLAFGWCVWQLVRLLHLPRVEHYGVTWREEDR